MKKEFSLIDYGIMFGTALFIPILEALPPIMNAKIGEKQE